MNLDIKGQLVWEDSIEIFNQLEEIEKEYKSILDANSRVVYENDMIEVEPLNVTILSNGGVSWILNAVYDKLMDIKSMGIEIITHAYGVCASAGLCLFLAGDKRYAGEGTVFMYHAEQYANIQDDINNVIEFAQFVKENDRFEKIFIENTNVTKEMLDEHKGRDWYFGYDLAMKIGLLTPIEVEEEKEYIITESECIKVMRDAGYTVVTDEEFANMNKLTKEESI